MKLSKATVQGARSVRSGWRTVALRDICKVVGGSTPPSGVPEFWNGDIVWITPTDLGQLETPAISTSARRITKAGYESCGTELLPIGTVVMSSRAPIGHLGVAAVPLCTNQGCKSFVPGPNIDSTFLFHLLRSRVPALRAIGSGATFAEVSKTQVEAFSVVIPSLAEQRRIAARIDDHLAFVERARAAAADRDVAASQLGTAILRTTFSNIVPLSVGRGRSPAPAGWRWVTLGTIARLESGHTPSRYHPEWWGGDIPWLALPDIRNLDGRVAMKTIEYTNPDGIANSSARVLPAGTICLSRTASVGFVTTLGRPMATSQDFVNWVCGPELDPGFLAFLLQASRTFFRALSSGATHKTVYMPTVKSFEVCIPRLPVQKALAAEVARQLAIAERLKASSNESFDSLTRMPSAMLRAAFAGV